MRNKKGGRAEIDVNMNNVNNENNVNNVNNRNNELGVPLGKIINEQKKYSSKELKLKNMKWGMGLEHEVQYFYLPTNIETDKKYPVSEIVLFKSVTLSFLNCCHEFNCCSLMRGLYAILLFSKAELISL